MSPAGNYIHEHNTQDGTNHEINTRKVVYKIKKATLKVVNGNECFSLVRLHRNIFTFYILFNSISIIYRFYNRHVSSQR